VKTCIKELLYFAQDLNRDAGIDLCAHPDLVDDKALLTMIVDYGNAYLERESMRPRNAGCCLWFDIRFGMPALIGMTWAFNPFVPRDEEGRTDFFWRMWTEAREPDAIVDTLGKTREALGRYMLQHVGMRCH
jgi:hypothetical protein